MIPETMKKKMRRSRVVLVVLPVLIFGPFVAAQEAPEDPSDPVSLLLQEYEAALIKYVETPHQEAEASLTKGYVAALERVKGQVQAAGDLEAVLALRGEVERCEKGRPLPESDDGVHSALQGPRRALRAKLDALEERRIDQHDAVTKSYDSRMARVEGELAEVGRIDDAVRVRTLRNKMKNTLSRPPPVALKEASGPPKTPEIGLRIPPPDADGWITLVDHNRLYGCDPSLSQIEDGRVRFEDGVLRLEEANVPLSLEAKDLVIRAEVKKVSGQNLGIRCRSTKSGSYLAWHNGGTSFGFGRRIDGWKNIRHANAPKSDAEFHVYEIRIEGDEIELWVNGEKIVEFEDDQVRKSGEMEISALKGVSYFRHLRVKVLK